MNLRARARSLFGRKSSLSEHTVKASRVEHAVLSDVRKRAEKLAEAIDTPPVFTKDHVEDQLDARVWERLAEDLWSEFYGTDEPELHERSKIDPRYQVNRQVADKQARDEAFRDTRSRTRGQVLESSLGLLGALNSLRESFGDELAEHAERQNEVADAEDQVTSIDDMLAELRQQRTSAPDGDKQSIDNEIRDLAGQKRAAVSRFEEAVARQAQHGGDLIDAAKKAADKAASAAQETVQLASLLPGTEKGAGSRVGIDQMVEFADRIKDSTKLWAVLDQLGRLDLSMSTKRRSMRSGGFEELVDIELGNELAAVLPAEKALLTHPVAKLDFYRRFHERSLVQYEYQSELELKKGPVIFCTDGSGSMAGAPNIFARGLTLAACTIANREGRNAAAIEFGADGEMAEFFFPKDRPLDIETAFAFAEHFFGGGTDINQVLMRGYFLIQEEEPFHSADLVIVTDGQDRLTESTYVLRDKLVAAGVKIHGLAINMQPTQYLLTVCDAVTPVFDFAGPNSTSDRLAIDLT